MAQYQIRYFFEWGLDTCLWADNDMTREKYGYPILLSDLPLSPAFVSELERLCSEFQTGLNWDDPAMLVSARRLDVAADFLRRAEAAYDQLVRELGSEFQVQNEVFLP